MSETDERIDPKALRPGTVMRHRSGGEVVLSRRKEDGRGWWNTDGSGLADSVIADDRAWTVTDRHEVVPPARYFSMRRQATEDLSACRECGAAVFDRAVHDEWHDRRTR